MTAFSAAAFVPLRLDRSGSLLGCGALLFGLLLSLRLVLPGLLLPLSAAGVFLPPGLLGTLRLVSPSVPAAVSAPSRFTDLTRLPACGGIAAQVLVQHGG